VRIMEIYSSVWWVITARIFGVSDTLERMATLCIVMASDFEIPYGFLTSLIR